MKLVVRCYSLVVIRVKHADDYYAYESDNDWFQCKSDGIIGCNMVHYIKI